jgi:asparagine synthase (glutamine-hydrolysing)
MCGILGIINHQHKTSQGSFIEALNLMKHRGPDGYGTFFSDEVMFGHRRLSIIDLSEKANQPFHSSKSKACIIFNGEIYNYKELSKNLDLVTQSDTEVLLEGYLKYGIQFFTKIRGIYAFSIFDYRSHLQCILYRDPGGVKPLYYTIKNDRLVFGSEIKSVIKLLPNKPEINSDVLKKYIHLGYCPEPETIYRDLEALKPGHILHAKFINGNLNSSISQFFRYNFQAENKFSFKVNSSNTSKLLEEATLRNLVADVDLSIALSGGIDSSLIFAYANARDDFKVKGITVSFDEKEYDESKIAKSYALHLKAPHFIETVKVENKLSLLDRLLINFDQPYADSSFIPFYFLCKRAVKYSKVLIGGDSGDEIHNGYSGYRYLLMLNLLKQNLLLRSHSKFLLNLLSKTGNENKKRVLGKAVGLLSQVDLGQLMFYWESWFPPDNSRYPVDPFNYNIGTLKEMFSFAGVDNEKSHIMTKYFYGRMLSDYLRKSDMISMINSLEFRVPMLDEDLVQYSLEIPYSQKSDFSKQKKILRSIHSKIYPREYSRMKKKGFTIPLDTWLGRDNINCIQEIVVKSPLVKEYINSNYIDYLFASIGQDDRFASRPAKYQRVLILYSLALWYKTF